jgi:hypothetical protein
VGTKGGWPAAAAARFWMWDRDVRDCLPDVDVHRVRHFGIPIRRDAWVIAG